MEIAQFYDALRECVGELEPRNQEIFELKWQGKSGREIAETLDISESYLTEIFYEKIAPSLWKCLVGKEFTEEILDTLYD